MITKTVIYAAVLASLEFATPASARYFCAAP